MPSYCRSFFLFARPSAAEAAGRLVDFGDTLTFYNWAPTTVAHDQLSLALDWAAVGDDLYYAIEEQRASV
ncbi:MAG TPA: hypothetical protein VHN37_01440 [Actinomycetota bacterium]|nr:hypothetical protein [Actinomycetota bacterium]